MGAGTTTEDDGERVTRERMRDRPVAGQEAERNKVQSDERKRRRQREKRMVGTNAVLHHYVSGGGRSGRW
jgi:hypothetical protein